MTARGISTSNVQMLVDKPFLFALRQDTTGLVVILGYVGDPTSAQVPKS